MKAIVFDQSLAIIESNALYETELPKPEASGRDLLVKVQAISVNPVDSKLRLRSLPEKGEPKTLGFDAVGIVEEVGDKVCLFKKGDRVFYAGDMTRAGSNAEYQLVDERIVGSAPSSLTDEGLAAMPLTSITAHELLFDRLQFDQTSSYTKQPNVLLVTAGAGGVGSALIQLAKAKCRKHIVIATASKEESKEYCIQLGADYVIDHSAQGESIAAQIKGLGIAPVSHIASLTHTSQHFDDFVEVIKPQGKIALIDDPTEPLNIQTLKLKSVSLHWELMFTRSKFETDDMVRQHFILNEVSELLERDKIQSTMKQHFGSINAANLIKAHEAIESGQTMGKIVLSGWD